MVDEKQEQLTSPLTYGFEGGSISLVPYQEWEINGKKAVTHAHIKIVQTSASGKPIEARILGKNGYDSILKVLQSRSGRSFRESLADSLKLEDIDQIS